jgi:hypothetical protein
LNRHFAILAFLSDGKETVTIGEAPEEQIVLASRLNSGTVTTSLDEGALEAWRATFAVPFDEGGTVDDGEEDVSAEDDDDG